uniref:uncharacterized protein LOC122610872 n=1 Tax=Erigeron canadensis TaxID=72917 RepID=UPI001CB9B6B8|nr:uncharacterized protein LOC122610872 [Erigeron canadensis]
MSELQLIGGIKKLNNQNYNSWATCMKSYLQGQDLWDVVEGTDVEPPSENEHEALRKWRIKSGKAMFVLKTTVEEEVLDHIREAESSKDAWDELKTLLSKKNDTKLQLLENELLSVSQRDQTIPQYFHKVKTLCREISELDAEAKIGDARMKRIIIHGLKPEFHSYVAAVQGWQKQPSLGEFENILASQEALAKQMGDMSIVAVSKNEPEALYAGRSKGRNYHKSGGQKPNNNSYKSDAQNNNKKEFQPKKGYEKEKRENGSDKN